MTAIIGILNKHAVAVAADSAVTIGKGLKIYNKANKIFQLSKYHPVGISLYNSGSFFNLVPWEIIIKEYRKGLQKKSFQTVKDYGLDFIAFLKQKEFFSTPKDRNDQLNQQAMLFFKQFVVGRVLSEICGGNPDFHQIETAILKITIDLERVLPIDSLGGIEEDNYTLLLHDFYSKLEKEWPTGQMDYMVIKPKVEHMMYVAFTRRFELHPYTGIAFWGYGDDEIYPSLYRVKVYGTIGETLKWYEDELNVVTNESTGIICPMAQTDVMNTFIRGIDPSLQAFMAKTTGNVVANLVSNIANIVDAKDKILADSIRKINPTPIYERYTNEIDDYIRSRYVHPFVLTISTLEKDDLGEVAENLVYLTSLKRKVTLDQESVGGPVDVAVVTKGDGFIWLKRKHYFDPSINRQFFDTYYE